MVVRFLDSRVSAAQKMLLRYAVPRPESGADVARPRMKPIAKLISPFSVQPLGGLDLWLRGPRCGVSTESYFVLRLRPVIQLAMLFKFRRLTRP